MRLKLDASPVELARLWLRRGAGDARARDRLVLLYVPLVKLVAWKLARSLPRNVPLDELRSYGLLGLVQAVDRYEPGRGASFQTFAALRVRGAMVDELRRQEWQPRVLRRRVGEAREARRELADDLGREPTGAEVAARVGADPERLRLDLALAAQRDVVSLDDRRPAPGNPDGGGDLSPAHERVEDPRSPDPADAAEAAEASAALARAVARLPWRERLAVRLYYFQGLTLGEVGAALGVTESRASQLCTGGVRALRGLLPEEEGAA